MLSSLFPETTPAVLALADGTLFHGVSIGANGHTVGEVVFNTTITGYQELLTDPSYCQQIITLTYPHIGSVGVNSQDKEADRIHAAGLIIRDYPQVVSNFRSESDLQTYLVQNNTVAIAGIDTRQLTRILREKGSQAGCIAVGLTDEQAIAHAKKFAGLGGQDLAQVVSTPSTYEWTEGTWTLQNGFKKPVRNNLHVVVYDFGVKRNILRLLADLGAKITVVPAKTPIEDVLALNPTGVFLSNGPGDPEPCTYAIAATKVCIERKIPVFGICLGHQILGLAVGAKTRKMKFGHHGANHPVQNMQTKKVYITTQNHGFEVDASTLPATATVTHVSLFDGSLQGFELSNAPAFCFQGHPEASSGPQDIVELFQKFAQHMNHYLSTKG